MKWNRIELNGEYGGDILGMAQIFSTEKEFKAQIPFDPPTRPDGTFQIPPGIRPVMKLTRIEVCYDEQRGSNFAQFN